MRFENSIRACSYIPLYLQQREHEYVKLTQHHIFIWWNDAFFVPHLAYNTRTDAWCNF